MLSDKDKNFPVVEVPLNGGLVTAEDQTVIGTPHFSILRNLRPGRKNPKPMFGMSKINSAATAQTALRSGHHFRKSSESHVLVEGGRVVYDASTVAVPGADSFTSIYTDSDAGALAGRYADAPGEMLCRCTGKEALLWGGTEHRVAKFLDYPTTNEIYDYTEQVQNDLDDDNNLATIHTATNAIDAYTKGLWHFDGDLEDATANNHDLTAVGNATTSVTKMKFGTRAGYVDGTGDYFTAAAHADFDLDGGIGTIDLWIRNSAETNGVPSGTYFSRYVDASNYIRLYRSGNYFYFDMKNTAAQVTFNGLAQWPSSPVNPAFSHIEIDFNKVDTTYYYYIFVNGALIASTSSATGPPALTAATLYFGTNWTGSAGDTLTAGYIDELRFTVGYVRHTELFSPPSVAYGSEYAATMYIASIMPLKGFKVYVDTANNQVCTMAANEWKGSAWAAMSITDNTASGGISLAQTGTVVFGASTATTSKQKAFFKSVAYWYQIIVSGSADFDGVPKIKKITVDIPMQPAKDLWDGTPRPCTSFLVNAATIFKDYTTNVFFDSYTATGATADLSTYATLGALTTSGYLIAGFTDRMMGLIVDIISGAGNSNVAQIEVDYWTGEAWVALTVDDGTLDGTKSFAKSGWITWSPPDSISEQKQTTFSSHVDLGLVFSGDNLSSSGTKVTEKIRNAPNITNNLPKESIVSDRPSMYYYRIKFNATLSTTVNVYHIAGIPAPQDIRGYTFALQHQDRLVLCDNYDKRRNSIKTTSFGLPNVFNGDDSFDISFGGDAPVVAGASIFTRVGSTVASVLVMCKPGETWSLLGILGGEIGKHMVSDKIGCVAPRTMMVVPEAQGSQLPGVPNNMAIWVSQRGVEMFDGYRFTLISRDIGDKFDPNHANYFGASAIAAATAWYDSVYHCYHLCIQGTSEWAYSFSEQKWFEVARTPLLYGAFPVNDTNGVSYSYGFANDGFVYRLNNGATWAGTAITYRWRTADTALYEGRVTIETKLRYVKLIMKANNDVATTVSATHYVDGDTTGKALTALAPQITGRRITQVVRSEDIDGVFHSTDFSHDSNSGSVGHEPLYLAYYFDPKALDRGYSVNSPRT